MEVSVNFYGLHRRMTSVDELQISLLKGRRVADVFNYIKEYYPDLPLDEEAILITVNNKVSSLNQTLKNYDQISFIPHVGGG